MPKDRGAEQGDVDGPMECRAWPPRWCRLKHGGALPRSRRQAASHGFVLTILQNCSDCKQTTQPDCTKQPTSGLVVLRSSPEPTTRSTR